MRGAGGGIKFMNVFTGTMKKIFRNINAALMLFVLATSLVAFPAMHYAAAFDFPSFETPAPEMQELSIVWTSCSMSINGSTSDIEVITEADITIAWELIQDEYEFSLQSPPLL